MAYTTVNKSTDYFNTKLYTGNGSANAITGVGFQPDWTWIKSRDYSDSHSVYDAVRGVTKRIRPNHTNAEQTLANSLTAFGSDGFTVGSDGQDNSNGNTYASWNWKANGAGSSNTNGSITSTVSANTTSGFSIVKYTGTGSNATVGHGLGSASPKMILFKNTNSIRNWGVYHGSLSDPDNYLALNTTGAETTGYNFSNDTRPTNSLFSVGNMTGNNGSSQEYIAYCFAEKTGYSKIGKYTGNGNADGTFVYTGFKPAWLMVFAYQAGNENWIMVDNKRDGFNVENEQLFPNTSGAEESNDEVDLLSNGFKLRRNNTRMNGSIPYIYMAFAEAPLVGSNNVPCTAR